MSDGARVLVHADESCLRNGMEPPNPGGAACLVELRTASDVIERRDLWISAPDTTNNRMALSGAIACLALLDRKGKRLAIEYVSDSQYLVKGMNEWVRAWARRGWKRKGGPVENLELWQTLEKLARPHRMQWTWVRGHAGQPKNEYANWLAILAARDQTHSREFEESRFEVWLGDQRERGRYLEYDPDAGV